MHWPQALDTKLFHLVNPAWRCSFLDALMPFLSGNAFFAPTLFIVAILLLLKGGARGRIFVLMAIVVTAFGNDLVCDTLKNLIQRPRPFIALNDVHVPANIGRTSTYSMPSSHAANCFGAMMVAFIYYRRSIYYLLPLACMVGLSRIYNGVHYPFDVLAGAILGSGYAAGLVWTADAVWKWAGERWFPLWWRRMPSVLNPVVLPAPAQVPEEKPLRDKQWIRLGYVIIFAQLIINLIYIGSGIITLSEDEAYQWIWSKHLALSYYSKPPMIALTQWLGTHLWGDTVFGVRFFSPIVGAITSICLLRFMAKVTSARAAFWLSIILIAVPFVSVGSTLMTVDPLSVMFWVLAMIAGWKAVQENSKTSDWFWVGLWMGLGFLSKYTSPFAIISWALFFTLHPPARKQLSRPGPYLALVVSLLCTLPVVIWNWQRDWITLTHIRQDGNVDKPFLSVLIGMINPVNIWHGFIHYTVDFLGAEFALLNPFFFPLLVIPAILMWRQKPRRPLLVYFFSMAAPISAFYLLQTINSRVLPNWIAPAIPCAFCLAVAYWEPRWQERRTILKFAMAGGIIIGIAASILLRDTNIIGRIGGKSFMTALERSTDGKEKAEKLRWKLAVLDSTRRVKGWEEAAQMVETARQRMLAEGKPVFIICDHYGIAGEMTFYIPEARTNVPDKPLVYSETTAKPVNQFYFWPGYTNRIGENALYIHEVDLMQGNSSNVPPHMLQEFESATNAGTVLAVHKGRPTHRIEIIECRNLRNSVEPANPTSNPSSQSVSNWKANSR